jgi:hypothetical protein
MPKTRIRPYTLRDIMNLVKNSPTKQELEEDRKYSSLYASKRILNTLKNSKEGMKRYDIGQKIVMSTSLLSSSLNKLAENGLLKIIEGEDIRFDYQDSGTHAPIISGKRYIITDRGEQAITYIEENLSLEN